MFGETFTHRLTNVESEGRCFRRLASRKQSGREKCIVYFSLIVIIIIVIVLIIIIEYMLAASAGLGHFGEIVGSCLRCLIKKSSPHKNDSFCQIYEYLFFISRHSTFSLTRIFFFFFFFCRWHQIPGGAQLLENLIPSGPNELFFFQHSPASHGSTSPEIPSVRTRGRHIVEK